MLWSVLLLLCAVGFLLTGLCTVKVVKRDKWRVELHLPLLALIFHPKKRSGDPLPSAYARRIRTRCVELLSYCDVTVSKLPRLTEGGVSVPYADYWLTGTVIALIESRSKNLVAEDGAFILSPDTDEKLKISFDVRLFYIVRSLCLIGTDLIKLKIRRKKNVGK